MMLEGLFQLESSQRAGKDLPYRLTHSLLLLIHTNPHTASAAAKEYHGILAYFSCECEGLCLAAHKACVFELFSKLKQVIIHLVVNKLTNPKF